MIKLFSRALACVCALWCTFSVADAQTMTDRLAAAQTPFTMPFEEVLAEMEGLFDMKFDCRNLDP